MQQRCGVPSRLAFCFGARRRRRQQSLWIGPPPNFFPGVENEQAEAEAAADYLLGLDFPEHNAGRALMYSFPRIEMKPEPSEGERKGAIHK